VNAAPDLSKSDPLFAEAFKIYQDSKLANEFVGLPVAEELMRQMDVEVQKFLEGDETSAEAAAATQKQWEAEFAK
jgi:multiple sugar transport system substrate-binding protein